MNPEENSVIIYAKALCTRCERIKEKLMAAEIPYRIYVLSDEEIAQMCNQYNVGLPPVCMLNDEPMGMFEFNGWIEDQVNKRNGVIIVNAVEEGAPKL